jgi:hypothetical protein
METRHGDVMKDIKETGQISDELETRMRKALDEFKSIFQPGLKS